MRFDFYSRERMLRRDMFRAMLLEFAARSDTQVNFLLPIPDDGDDAITDLCEAFDRVRHVVTIPEEDSPTVADASQVPG